MRHTFYYSMGVVLGLLLLVVTQTPPDGAKMVVCDVGQGEAILIIKGSTQALIDGGPSSEKILSCLEKHVPFWDRTIELIVLTNTDYDHMHGLGVVVERYSVMQFVTSDGVHESNALSHFSQILQDHQVSVMGVERGDVIRIGGQDPRLALEFQVLWPPGTVAEYVAVLGSQMSYAKREQLLGASAKRGDLNERSVVLLLLGDTTSVLLTGDTGFQTEKALVELGGLPDIDYLKVGHHGSKYASSLEFLEAIRPETAVISAGRNNRYGHPTEETLNRLQQVGAMIQRTDIDGSIEINL